jgi:hypothetical protein
MGGIGEIELCQFVHPQTSRDCRRRYVNAF